MATVEKSIEVNLPVRTVYNQWTQVEEFPRFMDGIEEVRQLDDTRSHWRAAIAGFEVEWDAEITEQIPDQQVAWRTSNGPEHTGVVKFAPIGEGRTRVSVALGYDPQKVDASARDNRGDAERGIEGDLQRFKKFIESRGKATGAWRGEVHGGVETSA
jgi:uncharacterized membrane protein